MASHLFRSAARGVQAASSSPASFSLGKAAPNAARPFGQQTRGMAGGGEKGVAFEGVEIQPASNWHKYGAKAFGATMWFWLFLRFKEDGDVLIYGHAPHFEHDDHH
ncbi:hypothetical protein CYMTET_23592 [Cymbomonas tetramitiformis]|uniref:Uncharacterized protein n=1 Tax=Cymbomonas tetramitiformis TaxID=36881 RepID=A0AAE0FXN5_9CHLO|nr:hypothetical protein CYMTET_23592 [Cymbomonas tetramitiformis]